MRIGCDDNWVCLKKVRHLRPASICRLTAAATEAGCGIATKGEQGLVYVSTRPDAALNSNGTVNGHRRGTSGYSLVEVVIAVLLLGILATAIFGAFSSGLMAVRAGREDTRATQILMQKMETVRLFTWSQGTNTALATTNFTDYYDPTGTNNQSTGAIYQGNYSPSAAPATLPADYRNNMRLVTVTLYWTNYLGGSKGIKVQSRQMQTYVARYGMQTYVYQ